MGHYTQEALLIVARPDRIEKLIPLVNELGLVHSGVMPMIENSASLCIAPSGSKYGWPEYYDHLAKVDTLKRHLDTDNSIKGGTYYKYIHVSFGEDGNNDRLGNVRGIQQPCGEE